MTKSFDDFALGDLVGRPDKYTHLHGIVIKIYTQAYKVSGIRNIGMDVKWIKPSNASTRVIHYSLDRNSYWISHIEILVKAKGYSPELQGLHKKD